MDGTGDRAKRRVLVVDDDPAVRRLYVRWLTAVDFEVVEADGGQAALESFSDDPAGFDLVILDMIMPDMSGFHTFELLRERAPDVRVLLCSGYKVSRQAQIILDAGAAGFLQKPFGRESLLGEVRRVLSASPHTVPEQGSANG